MAQLIFWLLVACLAFCGWAIVSAMNSVKLELDRDARELERLRQQQIARELTRPVTPEPLVEAILPDQSESQHDLDLEHVEDCDVSIGEHGEVHWERR